MRFSILHISDLHRDLRDEVTNEWLIDSLNRDFDQFDNQNPKITRPKLCIVSGDLVYGIRPDTENAAAELKRQYAQAEEFLIGLADLFFVGDRDRIVIVPGNHDICFEDVIRSAQRIEIPSDPERRAHLVDELFALRSRLRWS